MAKSSVAIDETSIKLKVDATDAIKTLKAIQREAREATKVLRELESSLKSKKIAEPQSVFGTDGFEIILDKDGQYFVKSYSVAFMYMKNLISAYKTYLNEFYEYLTDGTNSEPVRSSKPFSPEVYVSEYDGVYRIKFGDFRSPEIWDMYIYLKSSLEHLEKQTVTPNNNSDELESTECQTFDGVYVKKLLNNEGYYYEKKQTPTRWSDGDCE